MSAYTYLEKAEDLERVLNRYETFLFGERGDNV